jgi:hypothetical protein
MKLLVHVGVGKTGSSSIQSALESSGEKLAAHYMKYLGIMLEHGLYEPKAAWQKTGGSLLFFMKIPEANAINQLKRVLKSEIQLHADSGLETLIWSNEWIGERADRVIPALKLVESEGVDVEIVLYVRRHDRWIVSSYIQWGIKNKTYPGPIRNFDDWLKGREFRYKAILQSWLDAFGEKVTVLNYDAAGDVTQHFFSRLGIPGLETDRENVSPSTDRLAAWAVFNNRFSDAAPEQRFKQLLQRMDRTKQTSADVPKLEDLFPNAEQVAPLRDLYANDSQFVNTILAKSGEPLLANDGDIRAPDAPTPWEMDRLLLDMIFHLQERVTILEKRLSEKGDN